MRPKSFKKTEILKTAIVSETFLFSYSDKTREFGLSNK